MGNKNAETFTIKFSEHPPIGLMSKNIFYQKVRNERLYMVCSAIARYYNAGKIIPIEWIMEYNELIEK